MIDHDNEKKKLKDLESELLDKANKKISVPEKRHRRQPDRFQPPHRVDLTECDDSPPRGADSEPLPRGADSEPLKTPVPVKVEKKKKQEKEKKKVEEEKQQEKGKKKAPKNESAKKASRKANTNLEDSPPRKKVKISPLKYNVSKKYGIDKKILDRKAIKDGNKAMIFNRFFVAIT